MKMQDFFEKYLERDSIFVDKKFLLSSYLPSEVLFREDLIQEIANILAPALRSEKPSNLFVSGNIDLINLILRLNEINADKKMKEEDLLYTESEFNKILFENRYESFNFKNLKEFLKIVIQENN